jgi:DNA polymerase elongation subunit (family B)
MDYNEKNQKVDVLIMIFRDEDTGEKFAKTIFDPDFTYYVSEDDFQLETPVSRVPISEVRPVTCKSAQVVKSVAYETEQEDVFWDFIKNKKFSAAGSVQLDPNVHGSDVDIEDYYIGKHYEENPVANSNLFFTKSFFDIEVDSSMIRGFPNADEAQCPINAISYFYDQTMTAYEFLLYNENNKSLVEFYEDKARFKAFKKRIVQKYKDEFDINIKLKVKFFDSEIEMIKAFFDLVHRHKPDFCSAWNLTQFDMQYFVTRIIVLGEDPDEIICDPELDYMYTNLKIDTQHQDPAEKNSYFQSVDYTVWYDQLILYAILRKQMGKKDSYKLDDIAFEEVGARKVHFANPNTTMKTSCYDDFEEFTEYSIHDSILLFLIERKNKDFDMIWTIAAKTETRINKAMTKTTCLKNLARRFYLSQGYIMSNNHNTSYGGINEHSSKSFRGAFVADPNLNSHLGMKINGMLSMFIFKYVIDFDLTSLYPSIIMAFNIDASTQIGRVIFDGEEERLENGEEGWNGADFADDIESRDFINIGKKYFNLPNVTEMLESFKKVS